MTRNYQFFGIFYDGTIFKLFYTCTGYVTEFNSKWQNLGLFRVNQISVGKKT